MIYDEKLSELEQIYNSLDETFYKYRCEVLYVDHRWYATIGEDCFVQESRFDAYDFILDWLTT